MRTPPKSSLTTSSSNGDHKSGDTKTTPIETIKKSLIELATEVQTIYNTKYPPQVPTSRKSFFQKAGEKLGLTKQSVPSDPFVIEGGRDAVNSWVEGVKKTVRNFNGTDHDDAITLLDLIEGLRDRKFKDDLDEDTKSDHTQRVNTYDNNKYHARRLINGVSDLLLECQPALKKEFSYELSHPDKLKVIVPINTIKTSLNTLSLQMPMNSKMPRRSEQLQSASKNLAKEEMDKRISKYKRIYNYILKQINLNVLDDKEQVTIEKKYLSKLGKDIREMERLMKVGNIEEAEQIGKKYTVKNPLNIYRHAKFIRLQSRLKRLGHLVNEDNESDIKFKIRQMTRENFNHYLSALTPETYTTPQAVGISMVALGIIPDNGKNDALVHEYFAALEVRKKYLDDEPPLPNSTKVTQVPGTLFNGIPTIENTAQGEFVSLAGPIERMETLDLTPQEHLVYNGLITTLNEIRNDMNDRTIDPDEALTRLKMALQSAITDETGLGPKLEAAGVKIETSMGLRND